MTGRPTKALLAVATLALALSGQISSAPRAGATTTRTVTNLNDAGSGSLRNTIAASAAGDIIVFSVSGTITLTTGELVISRDLTIKGPPGSIVVDAQGNSRVLNITAGNVSLSRFGIINGRAEGSTIATYSGGGIYNGGSLT